MHIPPRWNTAPRRPGQADVAGRLLAASVTARKLLPPAFHTVSAFDLLLAMLVAEDRGDYLSNAALATATGGHERLIDRWISALVQAGLVETRLDVVALSGAGYEAATTLLAYDETVSSAPGLP